MFCDGCENFIEGKQIMMQVGFGEVQIDAFGAEGESTGRIGTEIKQGLSSVVVALHFDC